MGYAETTARFERMVTEAAKDIFRAQCEQPYGVYLYFIPADGAEWGKLVAVRSGSGEASPQGAHLAIPTRLPSDRTVDGLRAHIYPMCRRLPLLPNELR